MDSRDAQRQLLMEFITWQYAHRHPQDGLEEFLDSYGVEYRERLSRVEQELAPAVSILRRSRVKGVPSVAVEGLTVRIQTALSLLKGEQ